MEHIYEVVDSTDDEIYHTLGLFFSFEDALATIRDLEEPPVDDPEGEVTLSVYKRTTGSLIWSDNGKLVATVTFREIWDEEKEDYRFKGPTIWMPNIKSPEKLKNP